MSVRIFSLAAFIVLGVACGDGESSPPPSGPVPTTAPPASTVPAPENPATTATIAAPTTTTIAPQARPADAAPDFTLALGDGGTFVLSQESKPVFLVFWAEW